MTAAVRRPSGVVAVWTGLETAHPAPGGASGGDGRAIDEDSLLQKVVSHMVLE